MPLTKKYVQISGSSSVDSVQQTSEYRFPGTVEKTIMSMVSNVSIRMSSRLLEIAGSLHQNVMMELGVPSQHCGRELSLAFSRGKT
jgi:hypothetical protein